MLCSHAFKHLKYCMFIVNKYTFLLTEIAFCMILEFFNVQAFDPLIPPTSKGHFSSLISNFESPYYDFIIPLFHN